MGDELKNTDVRGQRLANLERLKQLGYSPYGKAFARTGRLADVRAQYAEHKVVSVAGRIVTKREMGKSIFAHIQDGTDRFQVYLKRDVVGDAAFDAFAVVDIGDQVGAEGELFVTRTGEQTLKVTSWTLLSKALRPLPEKWHGLQDTEIRYRQRYLDFIANPEVREIFEKRMAVIWNIREFLKERGYLEVETPMLQPLAGGAAANPFRTYYQALGTEMFLRIAPELYLKRLLVGGWDKVYEINRNFRNEGLSRKHNPEFTMLEIYEAYGDVNTIKNLLQEMIVYVAQKVMGTLKVGGGKIDLTPPWREVTYEALVRETAGNDWFELPAEKALARAVELGVVMPEGTDHLTVTHEIYEKVIEKTLIQPTFVTKLPAQLVPLAKACPDDNRWVDVFELEINGSELAPGYSELNDPLEQRLRLEEQAQGDASKIDEDFITSLEYGMPPAGGAGMGIDRLIMLLTGAESIRDVILFPQLKPTNA